MEEKKKAQAGQRGGDNKAWGDSESSALLRLKWGLTETIFKKKKNTMNTEQERIASFSEQCGTQRAELIKKNDTWLTLIENCSSSKTVKN